MRRVAAVALLTSLLAAGVTPAQAQQQPAAPAPQPDQNFTIIVPKSAREATRAREQEFYPGEDIRVRHEPAFIGGMSGTSAGPIKRYGVSGWTSPPGRGDGIMTHETSGWFGFGFSFTWE